MGELFTRPNGQKVSLVEIAAIVAKYIVANPHAKYDITVGTDSQSYDKTKVAEVVAVHRVGAGGIFFYRISYVNRINNLRQKIQTETQCSLTIADELLAQIETDLMAVDICMNDMDVHFLIHCDVGYNGSTKVLIQEIVGWVQSMGYECCIKPASYAASAVADKYSK